MTCDRPSPWLFQRRRRRFAVLLTLASALVLGVLASPAAAWTAQGSGTGAHLFAVTYVDASHGWAVGSGGTVIRTTDGGSTWEPQASGTGVDLYGVSFSSTATGWAVGEWGTILRTTDGGETWSPQNSGTTATLRAVKFRDANRGLIAGENGTILVTGNAGDLWGARNSGTSGTLHSVAFFSNGPGATGIAVGDGGVIVRATVQGMATWYPVTSRTGEDLLGVSFSDMNNGWAVGQNGMVCRTTDGGLTWSAQSVFPGTTLSAVSFADTQHGCVLGDVALVTSDGGATWDHQPVPVTAPLLAVALPSATSATAVGYDGTIVAEPFPYWTRVEENDPRILKEGSWTFGSANGRSGGAWANTSQQWAAIDIEFTGSDVRLLGSEGPSYGWAYAVLDGEQLIFTSLYVSNYLNQMPVVSFYDLPYGRHTLRYVCTGWNEAASTGCRINLDAVEVRGTLESASSPWVRIEEGDARLRWEGAWTTGSAPGRSGGAWRYTTAPGASVDVAFTGTDVRVIASKAPTFGWAVAYLDGVATDIVDLSASSYLHQRVVHARGGYGPGPHTLRLVSLGSARFDVDAIEVIGASIDPAVSPWTRVENSDPAVSRTGAWTMGTASGRSNGDWSYTASADAALDITFDGTEVRLLATKAPDYGIAAISLDGGAPEIVDLYAARWLHQQVVYSKWALSPGTHTLHVVCTGTSNPSSTGLRVNVDAFDVIGTVAKP